MYAEYAKDPRMKINVGIRRRLAPLLDNGRDEIELMHAILFSLPGSPVLYYGDEIAMGDNVYLGDRDGVRTPMQWTGDRNGGFSRADFAQLYAPPLMDPVYGYQAVNVEAQLRMPTSLLRWLKRFIALRKEHPVFGLGELRAARAEQPADLRPRAHLRGRRRALRAQRRPLGPGGGARPVGLRGALARGDVRPHALPAHRRAALPAHARAARLLLVPAAGAEEDADARHRRADRRQRRPGCASSRTAPARTGCSSSAGSPPRAARSRRSTCSRRSRCRDEARCSSLALRRGALPGRHARGLPAAARRCGPPRRAGTTRVIDEVGGWTVYDALADPALRPRAAAAPARDEGGEAAARRALEFHWAEDVGDARGPAADATCARWAPSSPTPRSSSTTRWCSRPSAASSRATTPSSRCCASSPRAASRTSPRSRGWYEYEGDLMDATLGVVQRFVPDGRDGWELALDELGTSPDAFVERLRDARRR